MNKNFIQTSFFQMGVLFLFVFALIGMEYLSGRSFFGANVVNHSGNYTGILNSAVAILISGISLMVCGIAIVAFLIKFIFVELLLWRKFKIIFVMKKKDSGFLYFIPFIIIVAFFDITIASLLATMYLVGVIILQCVNLDLFSYLSLELRNEIRSLTGLDSKVIYSDYSQDDMYSYIFDNQIKINETGLVFGGQKLLDTDLRAFQQIYDKKFVDFNSDELKVFEMFTI